jgi:hypothetical protein
MKWVGELKIGWDTRIIELSLHNHTIPFPNRLVVPAKTILSSPPYTYKYPIILLRVFVVWNWAYQISNSHTAETCGRSVKEGGWGGVMQGDWG